MLNRNIYKWFQSDALKVNEPLHIRSGWSYLSEQQFNDIIQHCISKMNPPIKPGDSVFEMGCGVGAVLQIIQKIYSPLSLGGSDFSPNAIAVAQSILPESVFYCMNMKDIHPVADNSFDHVISVGAMGMYLTKPDMLIAIKEAVRMLKKGGSLCVTNLLKRGGGCRGSIIETVNHEFWTSNQDKLGIENIQFYQMKHQGDRYFFVCNKKN